MKSTLSLAIFNYLRILARIQLKKTGVLVVGVGGSSGKTSLSTLVDLILSSRFRVKYSEGKNSQTGLPLMILGLNVKKYSKSEWIKIILQAPLQVLFNWEKYDFLIAEMGIDGPLEPKNMSYLLKIVSPRIGVLTNISLEHSQNFDDSVKEKDFSKRKSKILSLTAEQENLLLRSIPKSGYSIINLDDRLIRGSLPGICSNKITISSESRSSDFYLCSSDVDDRHTLIHFAHKDQHFHVNINSALPRHYPLSILMAIAVAKAAGVEVKESIAIIESKFKLPPGRMSFFKGIKDSTIIDSSYNAMPLSVLDLLHFLKIISKKRRRVAIIGDMRELGSMSKINHEEVARRILDNVDFAILIGPLMMQYAAPIL
ncbi:hypothetical protein KKG52_00145, partial [Patescibacteria group bacterium]|nr:hypothetical protein [Patescibacteria group bacterium]